MPPAGVPPPAHLPAFYRSHCMFPQMTMWCLCCGTTRRPASAAPKSTAELLPAGMESRPIPAGRGGCNPRVRNRDYALMGVDACAWRTFGRCVCRWTFLEKTVECTMHMLTSCSGWTTG